ncbi:MAG TPA: DUF1223 domain-containing protein [Rhodobacteraceae bacterium]|nr:DUF1223 domain-containing protein [Paracoccaceae bacterium]
MRKPIFALFLVLASTFAALTAQAGPAKPVVLVELYTSQGCSSCPPADAMISELAKREDVLPLALHVDYWDYIGWADSFARAPHTKRQKAYARMAHSASIYTPQMVVEGIDHVVGVKPMKLADLIAAHRGDLTPVAIEVETEGDVIRLRCAPRADMQLPAEINVDLVHFVEAATVEILHGENAGKTITYANIVTGWDRVGSWDGVGEYMFSVELPQDGPLALVIQAKGPGQVLAAFRLR